mmetsp:Transcript_63437/g.183826  ORF Transcript_63437/g.183826 Transcript_63437/m.183826 type:complete len:368 (-) Transcript_63437:1012-2115(-)
MRGWVVGFPMRVQGANEAVVTRNEETALVLAGAQLDAATRTDANPLPIQTRQTLAHGRILVWVVVHIPTHAEKPFAELLYVRQGARPSAEPIDRAAAIGRRSSVCARGCGRDLVVRAPRLAAVVAADEPCFVMVPHVQNDDAPWEPLLQLDGHDIAHRQWVPAQAESIARALIDVRELRQLRPPRAPILRTPEDDGAVTGLVAARPESLSESDQRAIAQTQQLRRLEARIPLGPADEDRPSRLGDALPRGDCHEAGGLLIAEMMIGIVVCHFQVHSEGQPGGHIHIDAPDGVGTIALDGEFRNINVEGECRRFARLYNEFPTPLRRSTRLRLRRVDPEIEIVVSCVAGASAVVGLGPPVIRQCVQRR